jgi:carbon monoxide dehydrogenase subunit G
MDFVVTSLTDIENILQAIPGVTKIKEGYNPATWMLEVSSAAIETQLNIDFAETYANSDLYK